MIGHFAHSRQSAKFAEGIFCIVLGVLWGVVGLVLPMRYSTADMVFWLVIVFLALVGGVITLRKTCFINQINDK